MLERHRPKLCLHHMAWLAFQAHDPLGQFIGVGHGGGQHDDVGLLRQEDQGLLPHHTPLLVTHVVDLVEHNLFGLVDNGRTPEQHVTVYLRSHDDAECVGVDRHVSRHEAHLVFTENKTEFA